jgi:predicted metalloprotease
MEGQESNLVRKLGWVSSGINVETSDEETIVHCQKLENEGFGMLADKDNPKTIDKSNSVVCPDNSILTLEQIEDYWTQKYNQSGSVYSSSSLDDPKMYKARLYCLGFILGKLS